MTAAPGVPADGDAEWGEVWEAALTALEMDVDLAERMLALDHLADAPAAAWTPPTGLGPLPTTLVDRARTLLDRQLEVARRLTEAADLNRRHMRAAQAMRATGPSSPVYVDTPA
jgi:hypothetical protein